MNEPIARKSGKFVSSGWSPCRLCLCCGKLIVLLRLPAWGSKTDNRWYRTCYVKGWDGNPYYLFGSASPHPRKALARALAQPESIETESDQDPFFSL
jgi:hypothetical protein